MANSRVFSSDAVTKLKELVNSGIEVMDEVTILNEGLKETINAISEELEIKPSVLRRCIKIAYKQRLSETNEEHELINTLLESVGRVD